MLKRGKGSPVEGHFYALFEYKLKQNILYNKVRAREKKLNPGKKAVFAPLKVP